jgi:hypothetical protein
MNPINPTTAFSSVLQAFRLGLRDSFTLRALGLLAALWSISALLWLVVFLVFRAEIWHAMQTIATFGAAMGVFGTMAAGTLNNAGPVGVVTAAAGAAVGGGLGFALGGVLVALAYWLCLVITVRIAMELLLMRSIRAQALRSYSGKEAASSATGHWRLAWRNTLGPWLGAALVVPVFLLVPFVGGPLLAAFLAYLNVRTLVNDAFDGMAGAAEVRAFVATHRWQMLLLGVLLALLALVPFVGLLLPWATGSAVCHLVLRSRGESTPPLHTGTKVPSTGSEFN